MVAASRALHVSRRSAAGWTALVLFAVTACGRIGFALLPEPSGSEPPGPDAGIVVRSDAAVDASMGSSEASTVDSEVDATMAAIDATEGGDGATDAPAVDVLADAGPDSAEAACTTSPIVDYCTGVPSLPAPPVIDGVLDPCGPALVAMTPVGWNGPPPLPPFPPGNSASFAAAWRPDGLYVFIAVTTPADFPADDASPLFYGAGVELFVGGHGTTMAPPTFDNPGEIQLVVASPPDSVTEGQRAEGFRNAADQGPWTSTRFGTFPTPAGFNFEGFVVASDLGLPTWALQASDIIGFDVAVDVSFTMEATTGTQGHRVGQYFFHQAPADAGADAAVIGAPYSDPRSWCAPALGP